MVEFEEQTPLLLVQMKLIEVEGSMGLLMVDLVEYRRHLPINISLATKLEW